MRFLIEVGLEDLQHLPEHVRRQIQASLGLPSVQVQQPVQQFQPQPVPQAFQAPPVMQVPQKQPVVEGNKLVFKPDMSHFSQQSAAVDVMTGQPVQIAAPPQAPVVPQFSNVPMVQTVGPPAPVQQAPPMPGVDGATVKAAMTRTYNRTDIDGKGLITQVLTENGIPSFAAVNNDNAAAVYAGLQKYGAV